VTVTVTHHAAQHKPGQFKRAHPPLVWLLMLSNRQQPQAAVVNSVLSSAYLVPGTCQMAVGYAAAAWRAFKQASTQVCTSICVCDGWGQCCSSSANILLCNSCGGQDKPLLCSTVNLSYSKSP